VALFSILNYKQTVDLLNSKTYLDTIYLSSHNINRQRDHVLDSVDDNSPRQNDVLVVDDGFSEEDANEIKLTICAWVKDEASYLAEWIEHHTGIGFDAILLYNDRSSDETQCVLDAYAETGVVVRVPEDVGIEYFNGTKLLDHQEQVIDVCRKYLVDQERQLGKVGTTWMATFDTDEFLWINRYYSEQTAKDTLKKLISNHPLTKSVRIPLWQFGSSYEHNFTEEFVMKRFLYRYSPPPQTYTNLAYRDFRNTYISCGRILEGKHPYALEPKAMSLVSSLHDRPEGYSGHFTNVHCHKVAIHNYKWENFIFEIPDEVRNYFGIAHYKTKSREEFFRGVCSSSYFEKYFLPNPSSKFHAESFSPIDFLSDFNHHATLNHPVMIPFANELQKRFTNTSSHCTHGKIPINNCSNDIMKLSGPVGAEALRQVQSKPTHNLYLDAKRPLFFNSGVGINGNRVIFLATCAFGLRSVHWNRNCGFMNGPLEQSSYGVLAHEQVVRAHRALERCIDGGYQNQISSCPTVNQTLISMRAHLDKVILSLDIDAIHGRPYVEYADYILNATKSLRRVEPIVILSEEVGQNGFSYGCAIGSKPLSTGSMIYSCLQSAVQNDLGGSPITDVLKKINDGYNHVEPTALQIYHTSMREIADYHVNLTDDPFMYNPVNLGWRMKNITEARWNSTWTQMRNINSFPEYEQNVDTLMQQSQGSCMPTLKAVLKSGRYCTKLILNLHIINASGPYVMNFLKNLGLRSDLRFKFKSGSDAVSPTKKYSRLRLNSLEIDSRASSPEFWKSLYKRGLDYVNLDNNFLKPSQYYNIQSELFVVTMLRNPFHSFVTLYMLEVSKLCAEEMKNGEQSTCQNKKSLDDWIDNKTYSTGEGDQFFWETAFSPNYYVRILNGIGDRPDEPIDNTHLSTAKDLLNNFDLVLLFEERDGLKLVQEKLQPFYTDIKSLDVIISENLQSFFEKHNNLDIQLYNYAKEKFSSNEFANNALFGHQ